jgi:cytochrome oxidase Cu insertion factor (SCO1/SenC/PrrC family)
MPATPRQLPKTIWWGGSLLFGILGLAYLLALAEMKKAGQLPMPMPILGPVADFALTNENGRVTTLADLSNHVWVADIIFTRCAGPCPRMTQQMKQLEDAIPPGSDARLVTMTTDPEFDTPAVLNRYAAHYQADTNRWLFLTGTKKAIASLAGDSLKLSAVPVKPADRQGEFDLFIHTTLFVMVDKHAKLRGVFETGGDGVDWTAVQPHILAALRRLEKEP